MNPHCVARTICCTVGVCRYLVLSIGVACGGCFTVVHAICYAEFVALAIIKEYCVAGVWLQFITSEQRVKSILATKLLGVQMFHTIGEVYVTGYVIDSLARLKVRNIAINSTSMFHYICTYAANRGYLACEGLTIAIFHHHEVATKLLGIDCDFTIYLLV